jgi:hypothetical protein
MKQTETRLLLGDCREELTRQQAGAHRRQHSEQHKKNGIA